jgi:RNA-directed DNA polymerase
MNELDRFVKHTLHVKHYVRYTDDFAIASSDRIYLENLIGPISAFLHDHLALELHPKKMFVRRFHQGIDFLGYVIFPKHRLLRTKTRRRMFAKLKAKVIAYRAGVLSEESLAASLQSYLGVMSHANATRLAEEMKNLVWFVD